MDKSVCEEKNYRQLYFEHAENLRNFLYYKCGDLSRAEDLTHEAFSKLWENCKKVNFDKVKSFVFTVANRLFLNEVEHQKVVMNFQKNNPASSTGSENPETILREKEFKQKLEGALSELTEGQREVFLMNRIDKMPYQEIADVLGVSIKAVHKRMYKALEKLKNSVEELENRKI